MGLVVGERRVGEAGGRRLEAGLLSGAAALKARRGRSWRAIAHSAGMLGYIVTAGGLGLHSVMAKVTMLC